MNYVDGYLDALSDQDLTNTYTDLLTMRAAGTIAPDYREASGIAMAAAERLLIARGIDPTPIVDAIYGPEA